MRKHIHQWFPTKIVDFKVKINIYDIENVQTGNEKPEQR